MVSLYPPITTTTTTTSNHTSAAAAPSLLNKPFFAKPSQLSAYKNRPQRFAPSKLVSCKATKNSSNEPPNPQSNETLKKTSNTTFDRRTLLVGLGSIYGAVTTLALGGDNITPSSVAAPLTPDLSQCFPTNNPNEIPGSSGDTCCLKFPDLNTIKDFKFEDYPITAMKIRREAHSGSRDDAYLGDYKRALTLMKNLDPSDPRSFHMQALIHCAYCDGAYRQVGFNNKTFRIHYSNIFAPFHRWYLYFFERILADLIQKPDFALPYWCWDNPKSMTIPPMFLIDINSPLYNGTRNEKHLNRVVDLDFGEKYGTPKADVETDEQLIEQNLEILRKSMDEKNRELFFGGRYRAGDDKAVDGPGQLEAALHNGVHAWVDGDMGYYSRGGKDPLFYAHHANIDRMWSIWSSLGEGRRDLDDPDYLGASFVLWNEKGEPVRVYVRDCLDTKKLGYQYECNYLPWKDAFPVDCANVGGGGDWGGNWGGGGWGGGGGGGNWGGGGGGGGDWGGGNWGGGGGNNWGGGGGWGGDVGGGDWGGGGNWGGGGGNNWGDGGWGGGGGGGDWGGGGNWGGGGGGDNWGGGGGWGGGGNGDSWGGGGNWGGGGGWGGGGW